MDIYQSSVSSYENPDAQALDLSNVVVRRLQGLGFNISGDESKLVQNIATDEIKEGRNASGFLLRQSLFRRTKEGD